MAGPKTSHGERQISSATGDRWSLAPKTWGETFPRPLKRPEIRPLQDETLSPASRASCHNSKPLETALAPWRRGCRSLLHHREARGTDPALPLPVQGSRTSAWRFQHSWAWRWGCCHLPRGIYLEEKSWDQSTVPEPQWQPEPSPTPPMSHLHFPLNKSPWS